MKKLIITVVMFLLLLGIAIAENQQPTQQFNKIYLNPFYRESMALATNYTYTINVNPPDKVSSVTSAIISFNAQINGQSQNFTLWVNGQRCNTPWYYIATAFSTTGNIQFSYDCSNIINSAGTYVITIRSTVNTGAISGWLDLTYMNNPKGGLQLSGTEYSPGDLATIFVQLKTGAGLAISNGSCYLDIWYPLVNGTHPYTIQDMPMLQALGDDGLYYYDMVAPSTLGVYMLSAKCSYAFNWVYYYRDNDAVNYPFEQINSGTWQGGGNPQVLNSKIDSLYERCDGSIAQPCSANYTFNLSVYGVLSNITNINVYFSGESDTASRTLEMFYWNGTAFVRLTNTLAWSGTGGALPTGYDEFLTNAVPLSAILNNNTIKLKLQTNGSVRIYQNWLALTALTSAGTIQDVKGSSEMHITNIANASSILSAAAVWTYPTRNLTYTPDMTNYTYAALQVWVNPTRNLTYYQNDSAGVIAGVWSYTTRNLTYYPAQVDLTNYSKISNLTASDVWNYVTRTITSPPENTTAISIAVWNYATRNLTFYPTQLDLTNYSKISNLTASDVWSYTTRNLTYYPPIDTNAIALAVWNAITRNLTYYPVQVDMTNYSRISNLTANDVWTYTTRNLTYYPAQIDMTNYTLIGQTVWTYTNRNLTYYAPDDTNAIALAVWNATTRNLTFYPAQSDLTNYTLINEGVWAYVSRTLTQAPENLSAISYAVWNATTRDLTFYPTQLDLTNYTRIPVDVWNYNNRNLTFYPAQIDMTNYTQINEGVWTYIDRNLTYYPPAFVNTTEVADSVWNYNGTISVNILSQVATAIWDYVGKYVDGILG